MTTEGKHLMNGIVDNVEILSAVLDLQRNDDELVRSMRNIQKELMGFKKLVLTELIAIKQAVVPAPPHVTEEPAPSLLDDTGTSESPAESEAPTGEDLIEASVQDNHERHDQLVSPDDQETNDER